MVIGIDATRANKAQKTGVEWYSFFLIKEMIKQAPHITFRLYFNSNPESDLQNLGQNVEYRQLRWPFKYLWTQVRLSLEMLWRQPDVLFIPASIIPFISARNTVTCIHDVAYEVYKNDLSQKSRWYLRLATYWAKWFCRRITTVSEFSKSEIIKYYHYKPETITVTHLGLNWPVIETVMAEQLAKSDSDYLIFVSRLESKKNIARLMEVFATIKQTDWGQDLKLYLVGFPSRGWSEAQEIITKNKMSESVIRTGWISEDEKFRLIRGARALLHFAKYEGFGFSPLEAMAVGTPAIVNNAACLPEICGTAAALVDVNDMTATVEMIRNVLHNPQKRAQLIEAGQIHCQQYTWATTAKKTLEVLQSAYDKS